MNKEEMLQAIASVQRKLATLEGLTKEIASDYANLCRAIGVQAVQQQVMNPVDQVFGTVPTVYQEPAQAAVSNQHQIRVAIWPPSSPTSISYSTKVTVGSHEFRGLMFQAKPNATGTVLSGWLLDPSKEQEQGQLSEKALANMAIVKDAVTNQVLLTVDGGIAAKLEVNQLNRPTPQHPLLEANGMCSVNVQLAAPQQPVQQLGGLFGQPADPVQQQPATPSLSVPNLFG